MGQAELLIAGILVAVAGLSALARLLSVPYPILLVIGGAAFGFVPGVQDVHLDPDVVLVVFLPPLLYGAAFFANLGDMRANLRGLTLSAVGLVLVTMVIVAAIVHMIVPGMPWSAAFVLGAVVSPTDPLAGGLIMRRLGLPRRLVSAAEGEGLFNDATALVAYKVGVAAAVSGSFSLGHASLRFLVSAVGGIAIGLAAGTCGIFMGFRGPSIIPPRVRLQGFMAWDIVDFILNATLFVLVGLQLRQVAQQAAHDHSAAKLAGWALAISGAVAGIRVVWFYTMPHLIRALDRRPQ